MNSCNKLIISFMLLFFAVVSPMTLEQRQMIALSPSPAPAPSGPIGPFLPDNEVDAVNSLLQMSKYSVSFSEIKFLNTDCNSLKFDYSIRCNCSLENSSVCRVTGVSLSDEELSGKIPDSTGELVYLTTLDLSSNKLHGPIPPSFANLTQLSVLDLGENNLEGSIPGFLSNMTSLQTLYLRSNLFNGSIPPELGSLQFLNYLSLRDNLLSGSIPSDLGNLSSLVDLFLYDNDLSGELPPHLGNLSNLETLHLMNNKFTGGLPSSLSELKALQTLNVQGNSLNGTIPDFIGNWQDLEMLMLIGNNFEGPLPSAISSLTSLTFLGINDLAGGAEVSSFPNLENATSLRTLILRNCSLAGVIPQYIWNLSDLVYLDLSFNSLSGEIPAVVGNSGLEKIYLRRNKLNSSLPEWMLNITGSQVDVSENFFTNTTISNVTASSDATNSSNFAYSTLRGCSCHKKRLINVFACCSHITNEDNKWQQADYYCANNSLRYDHLYINCGGNATTINGSVYEADLYQEGASTFFLSDNKAWGYSSMGIYLETYNSKFIFNQTCLPMVDAPLYINARVSPISLKYFGFCLKNDNYTVKLHFAEIGWQQPKANYSTDSRGRVFNVDIQGVRRLTNFNIEAEAGGLGKDVTEEWNITINDTRLEIHLYWAGKGSVLNPTTYYGPLISAISVSPVPKPHKKKFPLPIIAAIVGGPLLAAMLILALCWRFGWIGKKSSDGVELFPGGVFNYQQIVAATNNFSPDNIIGEGGFGPVYKGVLPWKDTPVAVKQLSNKSKQGGLEFINEIGIVNALRHPNLVKILGSCAEKSQLLLVYEYMENKSLAQALFSKSVLSWEKRVKICIDVATGLAFLHESNLNIIHRDVKSTNILLDKEFNAKISDFGFARPSEGDSSNTNAQPKEREANRTATKIQGTQGYMAPECLKATYTPKVDVYSYGIVVLEIVSGKECVKQHSKAPTDYLLDKAYKCWTDNNLTALVDPRLDNKYSHNEAMKLLNLAMACVSHDPMHRPTMSEVVKILEGKKKFKTVLVPLAVIDTTLSESDIASGSTSQEIISETMTSSSFSKEIDQSGINPA